VSGSNRPDSRSPQSGRNGFFELSTCKPIAEPFFAILLALVAGAIGITLFSGLVPGHSNFDLACPSRLMPR